RLAVAIGWSGQWEMRLRRDAMATSSLQGKFPLAPDEERELREHMEREFVCRADRSLHLEAGQQTTHFKLHPGERVRTPRILLVLWEGEHASCGHNQLRRLLLEHYVPKRNGEIVTPPVAEPAIPNGQELDACNEENQLEAITRMASIGTEAYWHDAAWFAGAFPFGVGNWTPKTEAYPNGMQALAAAAHERGMGFVLWFEPGRVVAGTETDREHPEWLMREDGGPNALFDIGNPEARAWLAGRLSKCISDW
ncbi:unnamed protein product, partial [marine sediment metagenome]